MPICLPSIQQLHCGFWVALAVSLTACTPAPDAELNKARAALAAGDTTAAVIHLKNAAQATPADAEVRLLLGRTLLEQGEVVAAGIELEKAEKAGADRLLLYPLLARHWALADEHQRIVARFADLRLDNKVADAELRTLVATAHAALDDLTQARVEIGEALRSVPNYVPARILALRLQARAGDTDGARQALEALLRDDPGSAEGWRLQGDLLFNGRAEPAAIAAAYERALALRPNDVAAHTGLIGHWLSQGNQPAAEAQWQRLRSAWPSHPQTLYHQGLLAFEQRQFTQARDIAEMLLKALPRSVKGLQLAGAAEFELKAYVKAESYLRRALSEPGVLPATRRMLAQIYLQTGEPARALTAVQPLLSASPPDARAQALAAEAYLRTAQPQRARALFTAVAEADPRESRSQTVLALMRIRDGDTVAGFDALRRVAAQDEEGSTDVALIRAHLQRRELDPALAAAQTLQRKLPQRAFPLQLLGLVQLARNEAAVARLSFEQALQREPNFFSAAAMLAALDSAEGKPDAARARFEAVLVADPQNLRARLALAELRGQAGAGAAEVTALMTQAVQAAPDQVAPRVALVEYHIAQRDYQAALNVAADALARMPGQPQLIEAVGRAQAAAGDLRRASETFVQLRAVMPASPVPWQRQAEVQIAQLDWSGAAASLRRAIEFAPMLSAARLRLAEVQLAAGDDREAMQTVRTLVGQRPNLATAHTAEGDIHLRRRAWREAAAAYRKSLGLEPDTNVAARLHEALRAGDANSEATALMQRWRAERPDDGQFLFLVGSEAVLRGDLVRAHTLFGQAVDAQPEHAAALNNLAWISLRLGKPGAMPHAQKSNALQPGQPAYMDTLSTAHEAAGDLTRAIEIQTQAVALAPDSHPLRLRLAKLHLKAGQRESGRTELRKLAALGPEYEHHTEVQTLLTTP